MFNDLPLVPTLFLLILACLQNVTQGLAPPSVRTCEPIRLEMCKKTGYSGTGLPNSAGHETQDEAEQSLKTFNPLINIRCSSQLQFFLCSVHVPMCDEKIYTTLGPCRRLCETVRDRCLFILHEFGYAWPAYLNCSLFPAVNNHETMCMEGPGEDPNESHSSSRKIRPILSFRANNNNNDQSKNRDHPHQSVITEIVTPSIIHSSTNLNHSKLFMSTIGEDCLEFKFSQQYYSVRRDDNTTQCSHGCVADILYPSATKQFTEFWIAFWSTFCIASSIFTIVMFSRSSVHIDYPERSIVFMAVSYLVYSTTHLVAILIGRSKISCYEDNQVSLLIKNGHQNSYCTTVFILIYYSQMSSLIWWVILSFTLYCNFVKHWLPSKLAFFNNWYHGIAWGLPAVSTAIIYLFGDIGADELTGNCNVGNNDPQSLLTFIIIPTSVSLFIGLIIIFLIIKGYFKNRRAQADRGDVTCLAQHHGSYQSSSEKISYNNLSSQNSHHQLNPSQAGWISQPQLTEELSVAQIRLFLFEIIYFFISSYLLFVSFYEYFYRHDWYSASTNYLPNVEIMSLKIFSSFLAGMMTGIWIWMSEPNISCLVKAYWQKPSPILLMSQHHHHSLPVTSSSIATLDSRGRYFHRGSETTV